MWEGALSFMTVSLHPAPVSWEHVFMGTLCQTSLPLAVQKTAKSKAPEVGIQLLEFRSPVLPESATLTSRGGLRIGGTQEPLASGTWELSG